MNITAYCNLHVCQTVTIVNNTEIEMFEQNEFSFCFTGTDMNISRSTAIKS